MTRPRNGLLRGKWDSFPLKFVRRLPENALDRSLNHETFIEFCIVFFHEQRIRESIAVSLDNIRKALKQNSLSETWRQLRGLGRK
jgi:hypothetical protein